MCAIVERATPPLGACQALPGALLASTSRSSVDALLDDSTSGTCASGWSEFDEPELVAIVCRAGGSIVRTETTRNCDDCPSLANVIATRLSATAISASVGSKRTLEVTATARMEMGGLCLMESFLE